MIPRGISQVGSDHRGIGALPLETLKMTYRAMGVEQAPTRFKIRGVLSHRKEKGTRHRNGAAALCSNPRDGIRYSCKLSLCRRRHNEAEHCGKATSRSEPAPKAECSLAPCPLHAKILQSKLGRRISGLIRRRE